MSHRREIDLIFEKEKSVTYNTESDITQEETVVGPMVFTLRKHTHVLLIFSLQVKQF